MDVYRHFARVYDAFMDGIPYGQWAGYIDEILRCHGLSQGSLILDLGCGTGTMALLMAQKGYEVIGVDASEDMLSEAYAKMQEKGLQILLLNQDIQKLDLYGTVDAAYSTCDVINYILTEEGFAKLLKNVALYLNMGGVFIFDLKTDSKYRQLGSNTYRDSVGEVSYVWENHYDTSTCINEYRCQFTVKNEGIFTEFHSQRAYSTETVAALAQQAGLQVISIFSYDMDMPVTPESERVTYVLLKCERSELQLLSSV